MKKILLLGGSAQQTVAIRAAKKLGYFTIVCDYLPDNPGQYIADRFYGASTTDVEAIYEIARKEGVDGILAYASDPAALPAAIVAERLGLPTNPAKSVEILGLKHPWRQFLQKNGFACPKVYTFHPNTPISEIQDHSDHFSFPLVVKPTDSSGSKGVTMLNNWSGLEDAVRRADSFSRNKILLIEEYIQRGFPSIIGGDIFVWNGAVRRDGVPPGYAPKPTHPHREENAGIAHRTAKRPHTQRIATNRNGTRRPVRGDEHRDSSRQGGQGPFSGIRSSCGRQYDPDTIKRYLGHRLSESQCASRHGRNT